MDVSDWTAWDAACNQRDRAVANAAYDPEHIRRVVQNANTLAQREGGALAVT
jgi:hypothetical protein